MRHEVQAVPRPAVEPVIRAVFKIPSTATIAKPGVAVTLPVILVIGDEVFMAEKALHCTVKSGMAK